MTSVSHLRTNGRTACCAGLAVALLLAAAARGPAAMESPIGGIRVIGFPSDPADGTVFTVDQTTANTPIAGLLYLPTGFEDTNNADREAHEILNYHATYVAHRQSDGQVQWRNNGPVVLRHATNGLVAATLYYRDGEPVEDCWSVYFSDGKLAAIVPFSHNNGTATNVATLVRSPFPYTRYAKDGRPRYEATFATHAWAPCEGFETNYYLPMDYNAHPEFYPQTGGKNGRSYENLYRSGALVWAKSYYLSGALASLFYFTRDADGQRVPCGTWTWYNEDSSVNHTVVWGPMVPDAVDPPPTDPGPGLTEISGHVTDHAKNPITNAVVTVRPIGTPASAGPRVTGAGHTRSLGTGPGNAYRLVTDLTSFSIDCVAPGMATSGTDLKAPGKKYIVYNIGLAPTNGSSTAPVLNSVRMDNGSWSFLYGVPINDLEVSGAVDWRGGVRYQMLARVNSGDEQVFPFTAEGGLEGGVDIAWFHDQRATPTPNQIEFRVKNDASEVSAPVALKPDVISAPLWSQGGGPFEDDSPFGLHVYRQFNAFPYKTIRVMIDPAKMDSAQWFRWDAMPYLGGHSNGVSISPMPITSYLARQGAGYAALRGVATVNQAGMPGTRVLLQAQGKPVFRDDGHGMRDWVWDPMKLHIKASIGQSAGGPGDTVRYLLPQLENQQTNALFGPLIQRLLDVKVPVTVTTSLDWSPEIMAGPSTGLTFKARDESIDISLFGNNQGSVGDLKCRLRTVGKGSITAHFPAEPDYLKDWKTAVKTELWLSNDDFLHYQYFVDKRSLTAAGGTWDPWVTALSNGLRATGAAAAPARPTSTDAAAFVAEELPLPAASQAVPNLREWRLITGADADARPAVGSDFESGSNGLMVVYVSRNPAVTNDRNTDISYAYSSVLGGSYVGGSFSTHGAITNDARAESTPTVAFDTQHRAVCAWMRVKSENLAGPDPALVPPQMEIVWSAYSAAGDAWSAPVALTTNAYMDYAPRLLRGPNGGLLLYWLSNEGNKPFGDAASPMKVRYTAWDPATAWPIWRNTWLEPIPQIPPRS